MKFMRLCGIPDAEVPSGTPDFGPTEEPWTRTELTYSINSSGCNFNNEGHPERTPDDAIRAAFEEWQNATNLFTFREVSPNPPPDIPVTFLAFAAGPTLQGTGGQPGSGFVMLNSVVRWTASKLTNVVLHEIGHSLGLGHSFGSHIMNPTHSGAKVDTEALQVLHLMYEWKPPQRLTDRGTTDHAVLAVTSITDFTDFVETPHMVWKGVAGDMRLFESEMHEGVWTPQRRIDGPLSSHSPALVAIDIGGSAPLQTGLLMAWKGGGDDKRLFWTRNLGNGWEDQREFPSARSDTRPALANVNGRIFIACVGSDDDRNLYWSEFDGNEDWSEFKQISDFQATDSPALIGIEGRLYMFWKGDADRDEAFWSKILVDEEITWQPARRIEFKILNNDLTVSGPHGIGTEGALTVTRCGDVILLAWRGVGSDSRTFLTVFSEDGFGGPIPLPAFRSSVGPALASLKNNILMAWQGDAGDRSIHWSML